MSKGEGQRALTKIRHMIEKAERLEREELKHSEERLDSLERAYIITLTRPEDFIVLASWDEKITLISRAAADLLGYKPDELIGKALKNVLHPDDLVRIRREALTGLRFRHKEGHYLDARISTVALAIAAEIDLTEKLGKMEVAKEEEAVKIKGLEDEIEKLKAEAEES